jgi:cell division septation protein DedD
VRTLIALALVLVACGRSDRPDDPATHDASPSMTRATGPDPVVLRIPRSGGTARAYLYPRLDSAAWSSAATVPAPERILGFDEEAGQLVFADVKGALVRVDLRSGAVTSTRKPKLVSLASADGQSVFGVTDSGTIARFTPTGRWNFKAPLRPREILPQSDGSLVLAADRGENTILWHLWPPDARIVDSAVIAGSAKSRALQAGDRVVLVHDASIAAVRGRDLAPAPTVSVDTTILAVAPTPSGDRLYVLQHGRKSLRVLDRYEGGDGDVVELPGEASALRMDPLGRYLLVKPAQGDSAWVVAVGSQRVLGAVATAWRNDLPLVAPDGKIALASGNDVRFVDGETFRSGAVVRNGAKDFWTVVSWNGFRPRAASLDTPVQFEGGVTDSGDVSIGSDTVVDPAGAFAGARPDAPAARPAPQPAPSGADLSGISNARTGTVALPPATPRPGGTTPPNGTTLPNGGAPDGGAAALPPVSRGFFVSLASHTTEAQARADARGVIVDGLPAHVATTAANGRTLYRVILGPYSTRAAAARAGSLAARPFWIYEAQ